jgi:hypothetical protein
VINTPTAGLYRNAVINTPTTGLNRNAVISTDCRFPQKCSDENCRSLHKCSDKFSNCRLLYMQ